MPLAGEIIKRFGDQFPSVRIELRAATRLILTSDKLRVEQILSNLLSNALKYGDNKPVLIELYSHEPSVILEVTDHGIGIALEDQERIFQRFERVAHSSEGPGFGLGLWITREVVKGLGGTITVQSELGQGSTFRVVIPNSRRAAHQPGET